MFIAHAPAGYLLAKTWYSRRGPEAIRLVIVLVAASLMPDFDLLYFYTIDNRAHNHHTYWTHIPIYWLAIYYLVTLSALLSKKIKLIPYATAVFAGVMLHLLLDTVTGGIQWGYPLTNEHFKWIGVPAVYDWWVLNFVLHWTFLLELLLIGMAGLHWVKARRRIVNSAFIN